MFSDPVVGENFFGREEVIDLILKRVNALKSGYRQNIAIIGHQQIGKTSILRHFLHVYRDPQVLAVYTEIRPQALDYFVDQFMRSLLFQYLSQKGPLESTRSLAELCKSAEPSIPKTVAQAAEISHLIKSRKAEEAYSKVFELTSVITRETGKNCVVILDEFHRLGDFGIKNAFSNFGKRIMVQKDTMYLLASSSFTASRKILAEKLALLFGHFERVYLQVFDFDVSFKFVTQRLKPYRISDTLNDFLTAFTDGHPFFLETIVSRVREIAASGGESEVSHQTIAEAMQKLLYESQGVLNQYFMKAVSPWTHGAGSKRSHLFIMTEIAKGKNRLKDIAPAINRGQRETSRDIQDLMEHELLIKNGVFYRFHNKIFKFWLRESYEKKEISLLGTHQSAEEFVSKIHQMLSEYEELSRMDVSERILKLFRSFNDDLVELGEKRRVLPRFAELAALVDTAQTPEGATRKIIAKGNGRCWLCQIMEVKATEKEVLAFVSGQAKRSASQTSVMLALSGMEENARLLAKEKKIFTLNLSRLNLLMDLYGYLPIVRHDRPAAAPARACECAHE